ncbi:GtrA family protein [Geodermatophilus maliterrae]|uniref:GtrA family protein n=1 Tax=Geodermatophilus maliterrae TaxID=3162531 RepID=A0ABV3XCA6_9ACTN
MPLLPAVRHRAGTTWRLLLKELSAFGVVGAASFVLDLGVFQLLYAWGAEAVTAKLVSSVVAMTAAYVGHRFWSFAHRERSGYRREYLVFIAVNGATLLLSLAVVALVRHGLGQQAALVLQAANVASIGLGTVIRWFAYRRWVFRAVQEPPSVAPAGGRPARGVGRLSGGEPATSGA